MMELLFYIKGEQNSPMRYFKNWISLFILSRIRMKEMEKLSNLQVGHFKGYGPIKLLMRVLRGVEIRKFLTEGNHFYCLQLIGYPS